MLFISAILIYASPSDSRAIVIQPEADPVIPHKILVASAIEMTGVPALIPITKSFTNLNAFIELIIAPYPTTEAVLKIGCREEFAPSLQIEINLFKDMNFL